MVNPRGESYVSTWTMDYYWVPTRTRVSRSCDDRSRVYLKIKEWKSIGDKPLQFLGVWTTRNEKGEIKDDMTEYIRQIKVQELKGTGPLDQKGITLFRQLTMRLRWPAQQTMPHLLYEVWHNMS